MSCSCQTNLKGQASVDGRVKAAGDVLKVPSYKAHRVHPDESCIFCAFKHASVAGTLLSSAGSMTAVIGELELARRHTLLEYGSIAGQLAQAELLCCLRQTPDAVKAVEKALESIQAEAEKADGSKEEDKPRYDFASTDSVCCPLVGEIHVGAAWRLAFEIGYIGLNRSMIIGDLALAQEHLVRFDPKIEPAIRELRHRVETTLASDLNIAWPSLAEKVSGLVEARLDDWAKTYSSDLRLYLGTGPEAG